MTSLANTRCAVGWFLLGYLATTGLVTVLGFLSPFWAVARYSTSEERLDHARDLLSVGSDVAAFLSLCFVIGAWHLARSLRSRPARLAVVALGGVLFLSRVLPLFLGSPVADYVWLAEEFIELAAVITFTSVVWRTLRAPHEGERAALNQSSPPNPGN